MPKPSAPSRRASPRRTYTNGTRPAVPPGSRKARAGAGNGKATADTMAVLRQFRELFRVSQQHYQRIESHCGVSGAQLWALAEIERKPGLTVSDLARAMSVHMSTSSNLLDKLEIQGLARRTRDREDHRIVRVQVTPMGSAVLAKAPRPVEGVIPDAVRRLDAAARARLHADLAHLLELASVRNPRAALKLLAEP